MTSSTTPSKKPAPNVPYTSTADVTLFSMQISCFAARARMVIYAKDLAPSQVDVVSVEELGGFKSEKHLALHPLGKIPLAVAREPDGSEMELFESAVIVDYLAERFADVGPSFVPSSYTARARGRMVTTLLDTYVSPFQPYMYASWMDGQIDRPKEVAKMKIGFDMIERVLHEDGPFVAGKEMSGGDCALWGNLPFYEFMIPTFFGWDIKDGRPKLEKWIESMRQSSEPANRVYEEVYRALEAWWDKGHWEKMGMKALKNPKIYTV